MNLSSAYRHLRVSRRFTTALIYVVFVSGGATFLLWRAHAHARHQDQTNHIHIIPLPQEYVAKTSLQLDAAERSKDKQKGMRSNSRGQRLTPDKLLHSTQESKKRVQSKPGHSVKEEREKVKDDDVYAVQTPGTRHRDNKFILHSEHESDNLVQDKEEAASESNQHQEYHGGLPERPSNAKSNTRVKTTKDSKDSGTDVSKTSADGKGSDTKQRGKAAEIGV